MKVILFGSTGMTSNASSPTTEIVHEDFLDFFPKKLLTNADINAASEA